MPPDYHPGGSSSRLVLRPLGSEPWKWPWLFFAASAAERAALVRERGGFAGNGLPLPPPGLPLGEASHGFGTALAAFFLAFETDVSV